MQHQTIHQHEGKKYLRTIHPADGAGKPIQVDVYEVLKAFDVTDPALQHCIKKLLLPGGRRKGDKQADLKGAMAALNRAIDFANRDIVDQIQEGILNTAPVTVKDGETFTLRGPTTTIHPSGAIETSDDVVISKAPATHIMPVVYTGMTVQLENMTRPPTPGDQFILVSAGVERMDLKKLPPRDVFPAQHDLKRMTPSFKEDQTRPFTWIRVIDGDTFVAKFMVACIAGIEIYTEVVCRLRRVQAWELKDPRGNAARDYTMEWLTGWNDKKLLTFRKDFQRDKYGRLLVEVHVPTADGTSVLSNLGTDLLNLGHAVAYKHLDEEDLYCGWES